MAENIENLAAEDGDFLDPYVVKKKERRRQKAITERIEGEFELNLNAMIDMMTVLVTFLIQNFNADPITISESADLRIPKTSSDLPLKDSIAISITKKSVMLQDEPIVPIVEGAIDPSNLQSAESSIIPLLQQKLQERIEQNSMWAKQLGRPDERLATFIVDKDTPYKILIQVMSTASTAGVQNVKFAATKRAQGSGVRKAQ